jgi:hypothetical protein
MRWKFRSLLVVSVCMLVSCGGSSGGGERSDITLANLNFLHGIFCPPETESCRLEDRLDLLGDWIEYAGCPDVVTLQEISRQSLALLEGRLDTVCPFPYELVQGENTIGIDDETVLSRYPVAATAQRLLLGDFRNVLLARIDHPEGMLRAGLPGPVCDGWRRDASRMPSGTDGRVDRRDA